MPVAILASGQSLSAVDASLIKEARDSGKIRKVISVSNVGIDLAPWADALVSHDSKWWSNHRESGIFNGDKFCRNTWPGTKIYVPSPANGCNSGYMAMQIARDVYKAKKIILLGFDMHGTHYFGPYNNGLKNTTEDRFSYHIKQFDGWIGCDVINCTKGSAIKKFVFQELTDALDGLNEI